MMVHILGTIHPDGTRWAWVEPPGTTYYAAVGSHSVFGDVEYVLGEDGWNRPVEDES